MKQVSDLTVDLINAALKEDGRFEQLKMLGKGSFGCVCQARNLENDAIVAIKFLPRLEVNKYVETEIVNHSLMRHPHIIQFRDVFVTSEFICIVLEYAGAGTLHSYVRRTGHLRESVARWFFQQLTVAVDYCHKKGVANRDIKLENTLLHTVPHLPLPLLKMCDFGYSKEENKSAAKSKVGTLTYMAPEVLLNITGQTRYDGKIADIWSCGVMLYVMLTGRYPFDSPNAKGVIASPQDFILMLEHMVGCRYEIPDKLELSEDCKDLLRRMLMPEPHKRITTEQILQHKWFNTNLPPEAATMNDRCLLLAPLPGVPGPDAVRQILHAACATSKGYEQNSMYNSDSGNVISGGNTGSRESSGTRGGGAGTSGATSAGTTDGLYGTQTMQQQAMQQHVQGPQYAHMQQPQLQAAQQHQLQMQMWQQQQQQQHRPQHYHPQMVAQMQPQLVPAAYMQPHDMQPQIAPAGYAPQHDVQQQLQALQHQQFQLQQQQQHPAFYGQHM